MKKYLYSICFSVVLAAFTLGVVLDTFVISRPMEYAQEQINTSMFSSSSGSSKASYLSRQADSSKTVSDPGTSDSTDTEDSADVQPQSTDGESAQEKTDEDSQQIQAEASSGALLTDGAELIGEYQNNEASIKLYQYEYENTTVYAADVVVSSSESVRTAFANGYYGKNVTAKTSATAQQNNAILAINGDYYGARESGYVIRNGVVFRDTSDGSDLLCIFADGTMQIINSASQSAQSLVEQGVWQAFCFGPALLQDGQINVSVNDEVGKAMASNPRTAIGMIDTCHYVFVVSDGRTSESKGLSLYQLATFMQNIGVSTAYNLDGGGSSTLYFDGEIINYPTTSGKSMKERGVSDIVYIAR